MNKVVNQKPDSPYIIFDIDGTLSNITHRLHHINSEKPDWSEFYDAMIDDVPHKHIVEIFRRMCFSRSEPNYHPIIITGRPETYREKTEKWLMRHGLVPFYLFMRPNNDHRSDNVVKKEIAESYIQQAPVLFVVEDRDRVVEMWRELGYKCLQVQKGDY